MAYVVHNFIILVFVICSTPIVVLCKTGTFTVLQGHSTKLISCAHSVLKQNEYGGVRASESAGTCEGLPYDWDPNTGIAAGYSYALKSEILENFNPPVEIGDQETFYLTIPGMFKQEAKVELGLTLPNQEWDSVSVDMMVTTEKEDGIPFRVRFQTQDLTFNEYTDSWVQFRRPPSGFPASEIYPGALCKLTVTAEGDAVKFRLNNHDIMEFIPSVLAAQSSRYIMIKNSGPTTYLHSFKFSLQ